VQNAEGGPAPPRYPIESVDRVLRLLLLFREHNELRVSEACRALSVGQSTAHRLLAMLVHHGFVTQDLGTRVYKPGKALAEVGLAVVRKMEVRIVARPLLEELGAELGETVHLAVLDGTDVRYVDAVECERALRVASRVGRLLPAYATSAGKALLAELSTEALRSLYSSQVLPPVTTNTITRRTVLEQDLILTRERGYAHNVGESEEGVAAIGVTIRRPLGGAVAAISVAAPVGRFGEDDRKRAVEVTKPIAGRIAEMLA
jgi:DNA-binding IclR family transcriptional regulator